MGTGDALMASGEARQAYAKDGFPVLIVGRGNTPQWSDVFTGVPYLLRRPIASRYTTIVNGSGLRPYIAAHNDKLWTWKPYRPSPAEVVFTQQERSFARRYRGAVMVEPHGKEIGHKNKDWGFNKWSEIDRYLHEMGIRTIQCGPQGVRPLPFAERVVTPSFRHALAVLSYTKAFVGGEGGLTHGAAAVNVPAVIVFGGFISPRVTGYDTNVNIFTGTDLGCGSRVDCSHCRECMDKIPVEQVVNSLRGFIQ